MSVTAKLTGTPVLILNKAPTESETRGAQHANIMAARIVGEASYYRRRVSSQYYCQTKLADRKRQPFKNKVLNLRKKMETKEERNFSLKFLNGKHGSKENVKKKTGFSY